MSDDALVKRFDSAMFDIYMRAKKEAKYNATVFYGMINDRGGLATAKYLINSPKESDGYTALYLKGHLNLTVEATVLENPMWHELFTPEELQRCHERLTQRGYTPKTSGK